MEELVERSVDNCIAQAGACSCKRCRADICALALNRLPPRYVVTDMGDIFERVNAVSLQSQADIVFTIMQAIDTIQKEPRHDDGR